MDKPDVDFIEGLSPAISIDQKTASRNPRGRRSGTVTEIHDLPSVAVRARIGVPHCPNDGSPVSRGSPPSRSWTVILELDEGTRFQVLAPVVRGRKGEYDALIEDLIKAGYSRATRSTATLWNSPTGSTSPAMSSTPSKSIDRSPRP